MILLIACTNAQRSTPPTPIEDVVIIGGGASGMTTAKRLLELGITPLIIERESQLGGAGIHAGRFFGIDTRWQAQQGISDQAAIALEEWESFTGGDGSDHQIQQFLSNSNTTLEWLSNQGIEFDNVQFDIGAGSIERIHKLSTDSPHPLVLWTPELLPFTKINREVVSVEKEQNYFVVSSNDHQRFYARNVVIASGGFARNNEFVEQALPTLKDIDWHKEAWPGMTGTNISLAMELGIDLPNIEQLGLYAHGVTDPILGFPEVMIIPALKRSLIINTQGKRTFNEELTQSLKSGQIWLEDGPLYAIFDAPLWQGTTFQGMGYNYDTVKTISAEEFTTYQEVISGETIDQLANQLGIPIGALQQTIEDYNHGLNTGNDQFEKDLLISLPIQTPPFYVVPLVLSSAKSFSGLPTNEFGQVNSFEHLYAVGEAAGFLGTSAVGWGFSGSVTSCYYSGKITAEHIFQKLD